MSESDDVRDDVDGAPVTTEGSRQTKSDGKVAVSPGGAGLIDGEINVKRFSIGPVEEFSLNWWNRRVSWQVRREPTNHRVVVAEVWENVWRVHVMIMAAAATVFLLGAMIFGGLSFGYAVLIGVIFGLLLWGLLRYEQAISGSGREIRLLLEMDTTLWNGIVEWARGRAQNTVAARKRSRAAREAEHKAAHKAAVKEAKKNGEEPPEYVVPDEDEFYVPPSDVDLHESDVAEEINGRLSEDVQMVYREKLARRYRETPGSSSSLGWGVIGCGCTACEVNAELGLVPKLSGVTVARKIREARIASGEEEMTKAEIADARARAKRKATARKALEREAESKQAASEAEVKAADRKWVAAERARRKEEKKAARAAAKASRKKGRGAPAQVEAMADDLVAEDPEEMVVEEMIIADERDGKRTRRWGMRS